MSRKWHYCFGIVNGMMMSGITALTVKHISTVAIATLCISIPWGLVMTSYAIVKALSVRDGNDSSDATGVSS